MDNNKPIACLALAFIAHDLIMAPILIGMGDYGSGIWVLMLGIFNIWAVMSWWKDDAIEVLTAVRKKFTRRK